MTTEIALESLDKKITEISKRERKEIPRDVIIARLAKAREVLAKKRLEAKASGVPLISARRLKKLQKQKAPDESEH